MLGHGAWLVGELVGAGLVALAVVLIGLLTIAAALHSGRTQRPVPVRARSIDPFEAMVLAQYARGEINAAEYRDALNRRSSGLR